MVVHNAYEVGIRLGAMTAELLKKFKDFVYSDPNIENAAAENIRWQPIRTLGAGGMGLVALWKKYNAEEVVIDVVAIKQEEWEDWKQYTGLRKGLSFEAIYQHQLNVLPNGENTLKIRRYRYYDNDEQTRYYFEFCPHQGESNGNLMWKASNVKQIWTSCAKDIGHGTLTSRNCSCGTFLCH